MIACLDVDYREAVAYAAGIAFHDWPDATSATEKVVPVMGVHPYQPGQFFRRELAWTAASGPKRSLTGQLLA